MTRAGVSLILLFACIACGTAAPAKPAESPPAPAPVQAAAAPPATAAPRSGEQQDLAADRSIAARTMGAPRAPVTIYEVSDFQCPYCREFFEKTLPAVKQEFVNTGKARIIFVNLPIVSRHPNALAAHEFAMCAADQGKFWPVHDLLYRHQEAWAGLTDPQPYFYGLADSAHLTSTDLRSCVMNGSMREMLQADVQAASRAGVNSTPSFIINGGLLAGAVPMKDLRPILDSVYKAAIATH